MPFLFRIFRKQVRKRTPVRSQAQYASYKEQARTLVHARLEAFNELYGFTYNRVAIKNQKTMWGSCSKRGNLNFNYRIAFLPPELADYVIVHELCHLKEFNHSQAFWNLVAQTIPDYAVRRRALRTHSLMSQAKG